MSQDSDMPVQEHSEVDETSGERTGWQKLPEEELPRPSYWAFSMGLAIVFMFFGIITQFVISGVGVVLFVIALTGWLREVQHAE